MAETICAIATAAGGALGIIRVSGDEAVSISSKIFFPHNGKDFNDIAANHATFGYIESQGQVVDEVVATPTPLLIHTRARTPWSFPVMAHNIYCRA